MALGHHPNCWDDHLHGILTSPAINLQQLKVDRRVYIGDQAAILVYVDDILVIGESSSCQSLISKVNDIFELKHVSKLGVHQDHKFLGHRLVKRPDNSISISFQQDYYLNMFKPYNLHHDMQAVRSTGVQAVAFCLLACVSFKNFANMFIWKFSKTVPR